MGQLRTPARASHRSTRAPHLGTEPGRPVAARPRTACDRRQLPRRAGQGLGSLRPGGGPLRRSDRPAGRCGRVVITVAGDVGAQPRRTRPHPRRVPARRGTCPACRRPAQAGAERERLRDRRRRDGARRGARRGGPVRPSPRHLRRRAPDLRPGSGARAPAQRRLQEESREHELGPAALPQRSCSATSRIATTPQVAPNSRPSAVHRGEPVRDSGPGRLDGAGRVRDRGTASGRGHGRRRWRRS